MAIELIETAVRDGCRQAIACDDIGVDVKTFSRWKVDVEDKRRGPNTVPANKFSDEEKDEIVKVSTTQEFMDLPPCQIVPALADKGRFIGSETTFYRVLKERKLLEHRGKSKRPESKRPAPLVATGPNQIFSWDITYLKGPVAGNFFYLYMFMDIFSRKVVGYEVHENECMIKSSNLIEKICKEEKVEKNQVTLHSDNGGAMKGATMLATLQRLGIIPSFSRPRVSDDNPFSESLFKTVKYCPSYPDRPFESLEKASKWVDEFVDWYNNRHLHSGIKFVTPADRHVGKDKEILERRKIVYQTAKIKNPNRWSKGIRNWNRIEKVNLNYLQNEKEVDIKKAS
jgi:transposase InsO family protein